MKLQMLIEEAITCGHYPLPIIIIIISKMNQLKAYFSIYVILLYVNYTIFIP